MKKFKRCLPSFKELKKAVSRLQQTNDSIIKAAEKLFEGAERFNIVHHALDKDPPDYIRGVNADYVEAGVDGKITFRVVRHRCIKDENKFAYYSFDVFNSNPPKYRADLHIHFIAIKEKLTKTHRMMNFDRKSVLPTFIRKANAFDAINNLSSQQVVCLDILKEVCEHVVRYGEYRLKVKPALKKGAKK